MRESRDSGPRLIKKVERLTMSSPEILDPVLLTARAQAGDRPRFWRSCSRSSEAASSSASRLEETLSVDARLAASEPASEPVGLAARRGVDTATKEFLAIEFKRTQDARSNYVERATTVAQEQYKSLLTGLQAVKSKGGRYNR